MFPDRGMVEVTCGWVYDADLGDKLGPASENQTYNSIRTKHVAGGKGVIKDNCFGAYGFQRRIYVAGGRVQDKETGKVWT